MKGILNFSSRFLKIERIDSAENVFGFSCETAQFFFIFFYFAEVNELSVYTARFCQNGFAVRETNSTIACKCAVGFGGPTCHGECLITIAKWKQGQPTAGCTLFEQIGLQIKHLETFFVCTILEIASRFRVSPVKKEQ